MKEGEGVAFGAATIVNAIATGKGAAFGVDLWTKAKVKLKKNSKRIEVKITQDPKENPRLAQEVVKEVFKRFDLKNFGAYVETYSNIPIARGLKSSSVAANAISLATLAALEEKLSDMEIINLGVNAAIKAGVTITGAFDDACASYFGNVVITDNVKRRVEKFFMLKEDYDVLIFVPEKKSYTMNVDVNKIKKVMPIIDIVYKEALEGKYWNAMTINGFVYATILGYNPEIALEALSLGALSAGLSGKGPAFVAVSPKERTSDILSVWRKYPGKVICTRINRKKSYAVN